MTRITPHEMKTETVKKSIDPSMVLRRELERRCKDNPRYSLRAFAAAIGMSPTALSFVLTGKRPLSKKAAKQVANTLSLSSEECATLMGWTNERKIKRQAKTDLSLTDSVPNETDIHQMSLDSFAFISDWYHYAILSLLEIPGARFEAKWICQKLRITEIEAKNAMDRLKRMEIVDKIDGRWRQATGPIRIGNEVPTAATVKFQKQLLLKAVESLENDPADVRDLTSMTLAMDSTVVPYAMEQIRKFRRKLAEELESKSTPNRVYELTVQLFPVSRPFNEQEKSK